MYILSSLGPTRVCTTYRLFFFRSPHLLHHLSQKMTSMLFINSTFYYFCLHYLDDAGLKKSNIEFLNNHDVIFCLNSEVNEGFWKRTTCMPTYFLKEDLIKGQLMNKLMIIWIYYANNDAKVPRITSELLIVLIFPALCIIN